jgi:hypothetical protein
MKYAVGMGSGAMIYIPSFICFRHSKVDGDTQTHRQHRDRISLFLFLLNQENGLKRLTTAKG